MTSLRFKTEFATAWARRVVIAICCAALSTHSACRTDVGQSATPTVDFTVNTDSTVVHAKTGLMWKRCIEGLNGSACATGEPALQTLDGALTTAKNSSFAGYSDWRLPNKQELESIIDDTCVSPAINSEVFPGTLSDWTRTSTTYTFVSAYAWFVDFDDGHSSAFATSWNLAVRLVRSGQSFDSLATCNLSLKGDGLITPDKDGVLLLRFLLGFRGAALIAGVPISASRGNAEDMANFIGWAGKYDVFGRPNPAGLAITDGLVLVRLMTGVPDEALLSGVIVPSDASFVTGGAVRANVNARCRSQL